MAVFQNEPQWSEPDRFIRRKLAAQPELFWVAEDSGEVVGTIVAGYDGVRGWIYHLAVVPSRRRKGLGRLLMQTAEQALEALGCPKINLQVRAENSTAVAFYSALGYNIEDRASMGKPVGGYSNR